MVENTISIPKYNSSSLLYHNGPLHLLEEYPFRVVNLMEDGQFYSPIYFKNNSSEKWKLKSSVLIEDNKTHQLIVENIGNNNQLIEINIRIKQEILPEIHNGPYKLFYSFVDTNDNEIIYSYEKVYFNKGEITDLIVAISLNEFNNKYEDLKEFICSIFKHWIKIIYEFIPLSKIVLCPSRKSHEIEKGKYFNTLCKIFSQICLSEYKYINRIPKFIGWIIGICYFYHSVDFAKWLNTGIIHPYLNKKTVISILEKSECDINVCIIGLSTKLYTLTLYYISGPKKISRYFFSVLKGNLGIKYVIQYLLVHQYDSKLILTDGSTININKLHNFING